MPEPPIEPLFNCPGGPAVEHDPDHMLARCACGVWFSTVMNEPTFPPHRVTGDVVTFGVTDAQ